MHLTENDIDQLTGGAECRLHYHPKDFPDINDLVNLQAVNPGEPIAGNVTLGNDDTLMLVDTSAGNVTVTMPPVAVGREYQITKVAAANVLYIVPQVGETILGSTFGVVIYNFGTCIHLKAVTSNGWMAI